MDTKLSPDEERKILTEARDRLKKAIDYDAENRRMAFEDLEFIAVDGKQWPDAIRQERESNGQPCLTINKLPTFVDQVVGDQRMNRPALKVLPVDSKGDPKVAKVLGGWIKHVQQISASDVAIDHGFEHAATCGYGAMRVVTRYVSDDSSDQEAYIEKIDNALAVYFGKASRYDCADSSFCFVISDMDREEYKAKYDDEPMPFNTADSQYVEGWATKDTVRVAEYFVKVPTPKTLYLLYDGTTTFKLQPGQEYKKTRKVEAYKVMWYLLTGNKVLDRKEWAGKKYIPIIPIWGKEFNVGGKRIVRGMIRNAKDAQRMYNYWQSCDTETVALQPRNPYIMTPKMLENHEGTWNQAGKKSFFYLLINPDKEAPGLWPHRETPPQASSAMVQKIAMADQEIRDTIGLQKAALGMQGNERSGAAIRERKQEGDVGTFAYSDNLARSMEHMGRILIDLAPTILDTARIIRLGLDDGSFDFDAVNVKDEATGQILNDLSVGTYDVVVSVGPSFTTQRTEAKQSMQEFLQYYPNAAPLIGDLYAKFLDWPGAEEIAERLEELLPPEIKAKKKADKARRDGLSPEQIAEQTPQPQPNPLEVMQIEEQKLKLQQMQIQVQQETEKLKGIQIDNEGKVQASKDKVSKLIDDILKEGIEKLQPAKETSNA